MVVSARPAAHRCRRRRHNGDPTAPPQGVATIEPHLTPTLPFPHHRSACFPADNETPMPLALLPFPAFEPVLFKFGPFSIGSLTLGPFSIRWYALAYICGILLGWLYGRRILVNARLWGGPAPFTVVELDDFVLWVTLGIILGGRIGYVLFYNLDLYVAQPLAIFKVWDGGMSFHGGFLGCVLAVVLFAWKRGIPFLSVGDITCAVGPIGLFLGRIANFVNGELWGRPTDVPWAMIFPNGGPMPRHPSQLYEATLEGVVLFAVLGLMLRFGALKRPGVVTGSFALGYGVARVICELFREPDVQLGFLWGGLTMGMLLCIPLMLGGIAILTYALTYQPKPKDG
jgi:phosphatidylglycerol:prolipoprotein diacylglycerol transferase